MLDNLNIRAVSSGDGKVVVAHRYYNETEQQSDMRAYQAWVEQAIIAGKYFGFVAEQAGLIVAGAGMTIIEWGPTRGDSNPFRGRIVNVYTSPQWRRLGIARDLVSRLIKLGEQNGIHTFSLGASDDGVNMYRQLGFNNYKNEMLRKAKD
ncbi:GNAT family N-acetyltransferase [Undibacterium sp. TC9W]|uniref:GNAT family N-acetyltransferase n=1 Tax=Undibacterium sp. TC9W TaxID=3413053 RepID=UPI003BEF5C64